VATRTVPDISDYKDALDVLYGEIVEIYSNREIWQFLNDQLPKRSGAFLNQTLTRWYLDTQSAAIRRIASKKKQDKRSFYTLLQKILADGAYFSKHSNGVPVSHQLIEDDLEKLGTTSHVIIRWVDEKVAHIGRKTSANPTFNDLDAAIDNLGELLTKYFQLITGNGLVMPPVIAEDWTAPFTQKWF